MSKSLKNFTTIRAALYQQCWSSRSLRICFLLGQWHDGIELTEQGFKAVTSWEAILNSFFVKSLDASGSFNTRCHNNALDNQEHGSEADDQLLMALDAATKDLDAALNNSFNTLLAMQAIGNLVNQFNSAKEVSQCTTLKIARWITRVVTIFGLDHEGRLEDEQRVAWSGIEIPVQARPFVYLASKLRDQIRQIVRSGNLDYSKI
jgi:cysteinyl-tRNA synthetase